MVSTFRSPPANSMTKKMEREVHMKTKTNLKSGVATIKVKR